MWRLDPVLSEDIAIISIERLRQVFGNRQDAADCPVHLLVHDQIVFDQYPRSWRVSTGSVSHSQLLYGGNAWKRMALPIKRYSEELTGYLRPVPSGHRTGVWLTACETV